uniref:Uncharacterized protein n=1 Tax=viral metagenome TaxID=1070528 RepID=A0A6C0LT50_9ZZZZ
MYSSINFSTKYYPLNGYKYINTPWLVSEDISNITKPLDRKNFNINDKVLVASGEQSFLQMMDENKIEPGKYCTITPCFRDESNITEFHKNYFMKTELIYWEYFESNNDNQINKITEICNEMIKLCLDFFGGFLEVRLEQIIENDIKSNHIIERKMFTKKLETFNTFDIVSMKGEHELGSYGIRIYDKYIWVFGTGCAEPRLSTVFNKYIKPGYHKELIFKTSKIESPLKIFEEYEEFFESLSQNNKLMAIIELSDLYGAIESYISKYNLNMEDLKLMSDTTKRAFINGRRT